jgi:carbon storage regulator
MLVISRKVGESIVIGDSIVISVIQTRRGRVRLGVAAPPGVLILRKELQDRPRAGRTHLPFNARARVAPAQPVENGTGG